VLLLPAWPASEPSLGTRVAMAVPFEGFQIIR
jgi:hypothetical protein